MSETTGPSERATEVADRLHSAAIHVLRYLRTEDEALGISAPRLSALSVLVFRGPLSVGELAATEQVTAATTSRLVSELEAAGLAERRVDSDDARVRRVSATPRGVELLQEGRRRRVARLAQSIERLSAAERRVLERSADLIERVVRGGR
ncbi:MAG TPA: MarR family transcriptional regulator [Longimicrobiaceae bacterium]|nr:MarR family transcriptional regulator [Longimicrobiaceae bacterium]